MNYLLQGPVILLARLILGGVFILASLDKISNPGDFAAAIGTVSYTHLTLPTIYSV